MICPAVFTRSRNCWLPTIRLSKEEGSGLCDVTDRASRCHSLFYPPYKVSPRVTEGWLNDTEMLIEASKMHPAAG